MGTIIYAADVDKYPTEADARAWQTVPEEIPYRGVFVDTAMIGSEWAVFQHIHSDFTLEELEMRGMTLQQPPPAPE